MSMIEQKEEKNPVQLQGKNRAGLKIVVGPDKRMRLVLDKSATDSRQNFINPAYLAQNELDSLTNEGMPGIQDDDFDF